MWTNVFRWSKITPSEIENYGLWLDNPYVNMFGRKCRRTRFNSNIRIMCQSCLASFETKDIHKTVSYYIWFWIKER